MDRNKATSRIAEKDVINPVWTVTKLSVISELLILKAVALRIMILVIRLSVEVSPVLLPY